MRIPEGVKGGLCQICAGPPATIRLQVRTMNGQATQYLCVPCTGSRLNAPYTSEHQMTNTETDETLTKKDWFADEYQRHICPGCGERCHGVHWHFWHGKSVQDMRKHPDSGGTIEIQRDGRVHFCSRDCCPLPGCASPEPEFEWADEEWDDTDDSWEDDDWDDDEEEDEWEF